MEKLSPNLTENTSIHTTNPDEVSGKTQCAMVLKALLNG